jgi:hypothetical protein
MWKRVCYYYYTYGQCRCFFVLLFHCFMGLSQKLKMIQTQWFCSNCFLQFVMMNVVSFLFLHPKCCIISRFLFVWIYILPGEYLGITISCCKNSLVVHLLQQNLEYVFLFLLVTEYVFLKLSCLHALINFILKNLGI